MTDFNRAKAILSGALGSAYDDNRYTWVAKAELCFKAMLVLDAAGYGAKDVLWLLDVLKEEHLKNGAKSWHGHLGCLQGAVIFGLADPHGTDLAFDYLIKHKAALKITSMLTPKHVYMKAQLCRGGDGGFRSPQVVGELVKKPLYAREFCKSALHHDDLEATQWLCSLKGTETHLTPEWLSTWISRLSEEGVRVERVAEHYKAENHALPPTATTSLDGYWQTLMANFLNYDSYLDYSGLSVRRINYTMAQKLGVLEQFFDAGLIARAPVEFIEQVMKLGNAEFANANLLIMRMIKAGIDCYEGFLAGHYGRLGYLDRRDGPRDYPAMVAVCASKLSRPGYLPLLSTAPLEAVLAHPQKEKLLRSLHEATGEPRYVHAMSVKERGKAFSKDLGI
ncbi:hypothetical protein [Pseudomonas serbica]|uniref:hypothetical protein n=1 Tax=Pseudomonas serbica TaxID=2965074 RepID=UPI00237AB42E|nr:hypothetical protein [Pseudomonas serbica]